MCKRKGDFFTLCVSPLYYEDDTRESLLRFKFGQCSQYATVYAPLMLECIEREFQSKYDILSWVPVSKKRLRERGYDQAELLAQAIGNLCEMKATATLVKQRNTLAQSSVGSAEKRRANISAAYRAISPKEIDGKRILLIDDIITTGATASECAKTLLLAGADSVMCATLARDRD